MRTALRVGRSFKSLTSRSVGWFQGSNGSHAAPGSDAGAAFFLRHRRERRQRRDHVERQAQLFGVEPHADQVAVVYLPGEDLATERRFHLRWIARLSGRAPYAGS